MHTISIIRKKHVAFFRFTTILMLLATVFNMATFSESVPEDDSEEILDTNTEQFWIWNSDKELLYGSSDPDTTMVYLASLTKVYTFNVFMENFKKDITIQTDTAYNYSKVKIGDTISYIDAISALFNRSCNTVAENMIDGVPKEGFISASGLPAIIDGVRYENQDTPTNILEAFAKNQALIEIYERVYDGRFGPTTFRKWTAHEDLYFSFIKTGFTNQAKRCVFIKTKGHYFLFVGWDNLNTLVEDSIALVRIYEKDHEPTDLQKLGAAVMQ